MILALKIGTVQNENKWESSGRWMGGKRLEGQGWADPLLSQCEQCSEPRLGRGCPERWSQWPGREHEAVSLVFLTSVVPFVLEPPPADDSPE